jgi:RHS repeat-associated protein
VGTLVSLGYNYGTSNNNGNVQSQTITAPGLSLTQTYGYDWLNRLTGMNETSGWSETFSYDPYGNRTGGSSSSPYMPLQIPTINTQTNKISAANHSYDAVGNLIQGLGADGLVKTYTYDADNRLVTFNGTAATYSYDGDGRRVKKVAGSATTVLVYDAHGQMVAEYSNQAPPTSGGTNYVTADHLGSTRLVTDSTGTVIARHDFAPFGEEISSVIGGRGGVIGYGVDEGLRQKFTGKERDSESGNDYFGARYYGANLGRFMTTDPLDASAHPANPQSWNRYEYAFNNPHKFVDVKGNCSAPAVGKGQVGICVDLYISSRTINTFGLGDHRNPRSNGGTYRAEMQFVVGLKKGSVTMTKNDPGVSMAIVPFPPYLFVNKGTSETKPIQQTTDNKGTTHFEVSNTALNGLSFLNIGGFGAPTDPIKTDLNLEVTQDGKVGVDGGLRTAYPSLEIWSYDENGKATLILRIQETKPEDLKKQDQVVPKVDPK